MYKKDKPYSIVECEKLKGSYYEKGTWNLKVTKGEIEGKIKLKLCVTPADNIDVERWSLYLSKSEAVELERNLTVMINKMRG